MLRKKTSTVPWNAWQTTLGVCWKRRRQSRGAEHDIGPGYVFFSIPKPVASTWSLNYIVFHPSWRLIDPGYDKTVVDCCLEMVIQQPSALLCCVNRVNGPVSVRLASSDIRIDMFLCHLSDGWVGNHGVHMMRATIWSFPAIVPPIPGILLVIQQLAMDTARRFWWLNHPT